MPNTLSGVISPKKWASGSIASDADVEISPGTPLRFVITHVGLSIAGVGSSTMLMINGGVVCGINANPDDVTTTFGSFQVDVEIEQGDAVIIRSFGTGSGAFIVSGYYWSAGE